MEKPRISAEEKSQRLAKARAPGASIAAVRRFHYVAVGYFTGSIRSMKYGWR